MKLTETKKIKSSIVRPKNEFQVGLACVATIINYYGGESSLIELEKKSGSSIEGINVLGLINSARESGCDANAYKGDLELLKELDNPVILYITSDSGIENFVTLFGRYNGKFIIGDPVLGLIEYREDELIEIWKSNVLINIVPNEAFRLKKKTKIINTKWFVNLISKQKKYLIIVLGIYILQAVALSVLINNLRDIDFFNNQQSFFKDKIYLVASIAILIVFLSVLRLNFEKFGIHAFVKKIFSLVSENFIVANRTDKKISIIDINIIENSAKNLGSSLIQNIPNLLFFGILLIYSLLSLYGAYELKVIIFIAIITCFFMVLWLRRKNLKQITIQKLQSSHKKTDLLLFGFLNFHGINLFGSEKQIATNVSKALNESLVVEQKLEKLNKSDNAIYFIFLFISIVALTFERGIFISNSSVSIPWLILVFYSVYQMKDLFLENINFNISFQTVDNLFKNTNDFKDDSQLENSISATEIDKVSIKDLSFSFPGRLPILNSVNLSVEKGKITIVNSNTGKGKSLLVSIITRFKRPSAGEILIDGKSWNVYTDSQWRNLISVVSQPPLYFKTTVIRNIAWGDNPFDPKKVISFCKEWGFDKYILEFSRDYLTEINDEENVSAGQLQLIAIAAAIYRKPKLLILDEPFTYMDKDMKLFCIGLIDKIKDNIPVLIFSGDASLNSEVDRTYFL